MLFCYFCANKGNRAEFQVKAEKRDKDSPRRWDTRDFQQHQKLGSQMCHEILSPRQLTKFY